MGNSDVLLVAKNISKSFFGVVANRSVSLQLKEGRMHALIGENGAGKTTFMNILMGYYQPDEGQIFIRGDPVSISTPRDAINKGMMMVHQHSSLIGSLNAIKNLVLLRDFSGGFVPQLVRAGKALADKEKDIGYELDLESSIDSLAYEERQKIEIVRTLCCNINLLILDEPTSMLTPQEADQLYKALRLLLTKRDLAILYSTHKLDEVLNYADEVTVLRKGSVVLSKPITQITQTDLVIGVAGEEIDFSLQNPKSTISDTVLSIKNLSHKNDNGKCVLRDISLSVKRGEIVGLAGCSMSGKLELAEVIMGLRKATKGVIEINNITTTKSSSKTIIRLGVGYVPPGANFVALIPDFTVAENLMLTQYDVEPFSHKNILRLNIMKDHAEGCVKKFDVKTVSVDAPAKLLSGGNMQKLIVAREFSRKDINLLILVNPTAGLDISTTYKIWQRILELKGQGVGIVLISEDLNEIKKLCDTIIIFFEGSVAGSFPAARLGINEIGSIMLTGKD
ncbi:hypothetical protein A2W24_03815 [Microgenomates group bacterium RBG_16_45_19]|nr:MAG: hypothetical protein A2W24_03815 [Microgenomates group bacterium RBG_16_45_19]